jgi:hypothetical protein
MAKRRAKAAKKSDSKAGCIALIVIVILIGLALTNRDNTAETSATEARETATRRPAATAIATRLIPPTARPATRLPVQAQSSGGSSSSARPGNCSTAVAMGLSAQQAAQWPHLDRDGDHVACYGD